MARLFVGLPTWNRPELLTETLASLRGQTFSDWRGVVTDNASAEPAARAVREHVESLGDPRLRHHLQPVNVFEYGQGRYLFSQVAEEEYFVIVHDDDLLDPGCLEAAVERLDEHPDCDVWVATPRIMDADGEVKQDLTAMYLERHGRTRLTPGRVPILEPMLSWGFVPVSGTVFRVSALRRSGFVDPDLLVNYPFELDLVLGVGKQGGSAWLDERVLISFRWHAGSKRTGFWYDPEVLETVVSFLEQWSFDGPAERLRRKLLGSKLRRQAELRAASGDDQRAREALSRALEVNRSSIRSWLLSVCLRLAPGPTRRVLARQVERGRGLASHG